MNASWKLVNSLKIWAKGEGFPINNWVNGLSQLHEFYTSSLRITSLPVCQISSFLTLPLDIYRHLKKWTLPFLGDPNTFGITYCFSSIFPLPILFAEYLNNCLTLRPETSTYDYYRANLDLLRFWVTWPACDVIYTLRKKGTTLHTGGSTLGTTLHP